MLQQASDQRREDIVAAENHAFFKGTIRFLYTEPDGSVNWGNFPAKFARAKELFQGETVPGNTIRAFLKRFASFEDLREASGEKFYFFTTKGDDRRKNCWKKGILSNPHVRGQVHALLMDENASAAQGRYLAFLESRAIEKICGQDHNDNYRYYYSRDMGVHREYGQSESIYVSETRLKKNNQFLTAEQNRIITVENLEEINLGNDFLWGREIFFHYRGDRFCWYAAWGGASWIRSVANPNKELEWTEQSNLEACLQELQTLI